MKDLNQPINITITAGTILKSVLIVLLVWFLFVIKDLLLIVLTAIVIASSVEPGTKWFVAKKIPRTLAVLFIYLAVVILFAGIFYFFVPTLIADLNSVLASLPDYLKSIASTAGQLSQIDSQLVKELLETFSGTSASDLISRISGSITGATFGFINTLSTIFGGVLSFLLIIVLSFYLAVQEDGVANFLKIVVPLQHEKYAIDLWKRSQKKIGLWMQGQLVLGVLVGVLTYLGLSILGVQNALFLAFIAGMFELIPVFGPILAAIPAVAFAFIQDGFTFGLLVAGLYLIIQQFESQLIHPLVVKKIVGIPAIIAIISLIIGAQIAGFLGIVLSVPIASIVMEYLSDVEKRKKLELDKLEQ
ncbi:MAG TPA: AI-2E family transporter [Candidatus Paceibacterota bacterium]|nr:AI-2E family transporter [Candidatus Paceibacterota bacterium]HMP19209.1 AI-2E family transporter [Candidatus Paceibacterota bacterium]HMP85349.1 AI-2E family transporter [Candidatus Paceibacterota bacterium]